MSVMSVERARELVDRIRGSVAEVTAWVRELREGEAWLPLGYGSWEELCAQELGARLALTRDERQVVMLELSAAGMTTREVGAAVGASHSSVVRAVAGADVPSRRDTSERDATIIALMDQGATREAVAAAIGMSPSHTGTLVAALGRRFGDRPRRGSQQPRPVLPEPEPMPPPARLPPVPAYRGPRSLQAEVARVRDLYRVDRWALLACHDANEAEAAGDEEWTQLLLVSLRELAQDLLRLAEVIADPKYRAAQIVVWDGSAPVTLRAVPDV